MKTYILLILTIQIVFALCSDVSEKIAKSNNVPSLKSDVVIKNIEDNARNYKRSKETDKLSKRIVFKENLDEKDFKDIYSNNKDKIDTTDKKWNDSDDVPISMFSAFTAGECAPGFVKVNGVCVKID
ncbi:unnamed protein product [Euphydryas editha]|uniref:Uncharacterized protein n=1 Tax=Euphydryas editha TaxID=104508 RepID=A0AAU9UIH8_EUPED|nr:unnamed protein product [Euphydryas editha]